MFGEEAILIPLIAVIYWTFNKKMGEYIAYSSLTSVLINGAVKDAFKAKRPIGEPGIRSLRVELPLDILFQVDIHKGQLLFGEQ